MWSRIGAQFQVPLRLSWLPGCKPSAKRPFPARPKPTASHRECGSGPSSRCCFRFERRPRASAMSRLIPYWIGNKRSCHVVAQNERADIRPQLHPPVTINPSSSSPRRSTRSPHQPGQTRNPSPMRHVQMLQAAARKRNAVEYSPSGGRCRGPGLLSGPQHACMVWQSGDQGFRVFFILRRSCTAKAFGFLTLQVFICRLSSAPRQPQSNGPKIAKKEQGWRPSATSPSSSRASRRG